MRDAVSEPAAAGEVTATPGAVRGRLRALWKRLPGPLRRRLRLPRLTRRRLAVLGVVGLLVVVLGAVAVSSTSTYSAYVTFRELRMVGIPSPWRETWTLGRCPVTSPCTEPSSSRTTAS